MLPGGFLQELHIYELHAALGYPRPFGPIVEFQIPQPPAPCLAQIAGLESLGGGRVQDVGDPQAFDGRLHHQIFVVEDEVPALISWCAERGFPLHRLVEWRPPMRTLAANR